jgi:hypothetical protein
MLSAIARQAIGAGAAISRMAPQAAWAGGQLAQAISQGQKDLLRRRIAGRRPSAPGRAGPGIAPGTAIVARNGPEARGTSGA